MKEYMITDDTYAILPNGPKKSIIIEEENQFYIDISPRVVIKKNALMYGSSMDGRVEGSIYSIGSSYKTPIMLSEKNCLLLFPTSSPRLRSCMWINLINVKNILKDGKTGNGIVEFKNGTFLYLEISFYILNNQYNRALRLALISGKNNLIK